MVNYIFNILVHNDSWYNRWYIKDVINRRYATYKSTFELIIYKLLFMSLGCIIAYYFESIMYEQFGARYIAFVAMIILLQHDMVPNEKQNIC